MIRKDCGGCGCSAGEGGPGEELLWSYAGKHAARIWMAAVNKRLGTFAGGRISWLDCSPWFSDKVTGRLNKTLIRIYGKQKLKEQGMHLSSHGMLRWYECMKPLLQSFLGNSSLVIPAKR
eukprot:gnl/TRDRNA2_/TRDRNA2_141146_c0_seq3.p1 gnl/TRDRNA2_/TRDRNA2_141146_c0~~gnl/TRDRNA2_/TRDRNA2_141146_c0_seq3.p1  ORF type:complete len:120 (+),score=20.58 gnl/TRDRNA2_/TRDRNA2_141146_c0_seq3:155-514(+)